MSFVIQVCFFNNPDDMPYKFKPIGRFVRYIEDDGTCHSSSYFYTDGVLFKSYEDAKEYLASHDITSEIVDTRGDKPISYYLKEEFGRASEYYRIVEAPIITLKDEKI